MNARCYKIVFSKCLGARVAVGEHASSQGKATGASSSSMAAGYSPCSDAWASSFWGALSSTFALVTLVWATPAWAQPQYQPAANALPTGGQVVQGAVQFNQSAQQLNIHQSTDRAAVHWQSFDIGAAAKVNIQQPSAQSVLLNRVGGESPSQIFGQLQANGKVILVNPNGLVIGRDGSVSAAGFTGSTLNISDADFMAGKERYTRSGTVASTSAIVNRGLIQSAPGGYVALLGASVSNEGRIEAPQGNVFMAAADAVTLPSHATKLGLPIGQSGRIRLELTPASINAAVANHKGGTIVTEGGQVYLQAAALNQAMATVLQSGSIDTAGVQGGQVHVLADGGRIRVDGSIKANSTNGSAGGDIYIGRDKDTNVLAAVGDASGAKLESKGGFVETSGQFLATYGTRVLAKDWLLDPVNITIAASNPSGDAYGDGDGATAGVQFNPSTGSTILASDIAANLNAGTNVTVSTGLAGSPGTDDGNITVSAAIVKSGANNASLTLDANNRVIVNARIGRASNDTTSTGNLDVTIVARGNAQTAAQGSAYIANVIDAVAGTVDITGTSLSGWEGVIFQGTSGITAGTYTVLGTSTSTALRFNGGTSTFNSSLGNSLIEGTGAGFGGIFAASGNTINLNTTGSATTTLASGSSSMGGMRFGFGGGVTVNTNGNVTIGSHHNNSNLFIQANVNVNSGHLRILGQSSANGIGLQDGSGVPTSINVNNGSTMTMHGISTASGNGINLRPDGAANFITMTGTNAGQRGSLNLIGESVTGNGIYTNGATITSDGGNINLTGTSQGTGITHDGLIRSGNDSGGGVVTLTGTSTGSVTPRPGINSATTIQGGSVVMTGVSSGVQGIYTAALLTATSGSVTLTGTSAQGSGVHLQGAVRATGDVIVDGTSTSANTQGVIIQNALESTSGHIRLTGHTSATTQRAVALTANGAVMANLKVSTGRNIDVSANSLYIHPSATVDAGSTGVVTLKPTSSSADILIGADDILGAQPHLGLSQEELGPIIAGRLDIGDLTRTGRILVSAATVTPAQAGHVRLLTGGDIAIGANLTVGDDPATPAVTEASRQLTLTSGGAITRTAGRLSSTDLFLTAASGIGSSTQRVQTGVNRLSSSSGGDQFISELDGLTLAARSTANNASVDISSAGTMVVSDVNGLSGVVAHGTGSIKLTATTTAGNGLTLTRNITSLGDIQLEGSSASTADYDAGIRSNAVVSGRHIHVLAQATTDTNRPVLGYYGAGGSFVASASLSMTGTTQSVANGLYTFGGLFQSGTGMTLEGMSKYGQGFGLDKQGSSGLVARLLNTTSGQVSITGTAHNITQQAIGLNGSSVINNGGGVALHATSGNIVSSINPVWGAAASNFNLIESGASGDQISLTAGSNSASTASIDGSFLTIQQNNSAGVRVRTEGLGHLTAPKVNNAGTGNVVLAAGAMLSAGNDGGGQVLTVSGQSVTHSHSTTPGKTYVYSGNLSGTGALSRLSAGFDTLFYNGTSHPLNMAFNAAHGDVISSSAQHQVLFRSAWEPSAAHSLDLSNLLIYKTYGDTDPDLLPAVQSAYVSNMGPSVLTRSVQGAGGENVIGLGASDAIASLIGTRAAGENASTTPYAYSLTSTGLDTTVSGQAGLQINKRALSAALQGTVSKEYDGSDAANNLAPSNFAVTGWATLNGVTEGASVTQTAGTYASKDVANNTGSGGSVTADLRAEHFAPTGGTLMSNYTLPLSASGNVGTITRAPLTVKVGSSTMFVTQDPNAALDTGITYEGLKNGETSAEVLGALTRTYTGSATPGVGTYTNVYRTATPTAANYDITWQWGGLNVVAADKLLIQVGGRSETYGVVTAANAGQTTAAQGVSALYCVGGVNCNTISTLTLNDLGGGNWRATDSLGSSILFSTSVDTHGQTSAAGFLNAGNHDYTVGSWTVQGGQNFTDMVLAAGSLVITPKNLSLSASNVSKVYDGTNALAGMRLLPAGALPGDEVGVVSNGGSFASKNAGSQSFTLTGLQLEGADRGNYSFASGNVSGTGLITPRQVTASFGALDKVYDGTRTANLTGGSLSGVLSGDVVSVGVASGSFADENVSRDASGQVLAQGVQVDGVSLSGVDAGNYQVVASAGSARITPKVLTAVVTAQDKVYDGSQQAQVVGSLSGVLGGDQVVLGLDSKSLFASKNVQRDANGLPMAQAVTVSGLQLTGAQALNYDLDSANATSLAKITPKPLLASAAVSDKTYDGTDQAFLTGLNGQGVVAGDDVRLEASRAVFAGSDVALDAQNQVLAQSVSVKEVRMLGADAGNYSLAGEGTDLDVQARIVPRPLSLDALAQDKMYDGTRAAVVRVGTLTGLVGQQQLGLSVQAEFDTPDVGSNKPVDVRYTLSDGVGGLARNYTLPSPQLLASIRSETQVKPVQPMVVPSQASAKPSSVVFVPSSSAAAAQAAVLSQDPAATTPGSCRPETMGECVCEDTLLAEVQLCYVPHSADELASVSLRP